MKLRLINPRSPLSTITLPDVVTRMTDSRLPVAGPLVRRWGRPRKALFMPLNLAICAALAPDDWQVEIVDECTTGERHTPRADVDLVGIGAMTTQAPRGYALADAYRNLGVPVAMGGIHPSALPEEAMRHADAVCVGDAESTLPHLFDDFTGGRDWRKVYRWRDYPDAPIATPRKDLLDPADYLVFNPIQTVRGCPHNCSFCTTPHIFGQRFRRRPVDDIVAEIAEARARGSNMFIFSDDNFGGHHRWAKELCRALMPLNVKWASQCDILISGDAELLRLMRASGCQGLILGLESPRRETLSEACKTYVKPESYLERIKKIQAAGISLWGSFIFGFDADTLADCRRAVAFARRANLVMSCYIVLTPYPGTPQYERFKAEGRLVTTDWEKYNGATVVYRPARMSAEELAWAQQAAFCDFYSLTSAVARLKLFPLKKRSWMANLAIWRGLHYYYNKKRRPYPGFGRPMTLMESHP